VATCALPFFAAFQRRRARAAAFEQAERFFLRRLGAALPRQRLRARSINRLTFDASRSPELATATNVVGKNKAIYLIFLA
jgi:hypothetical protein